jgi:DNA invertase Pin-like site-specific DNA recombinase
MEFLPRKRSNGTRRQRARWKRLRAKNPWGYDDTDTSIRGERSGRGGRWHLHDSQLANLTLGQDSNARVAEGNRAAVRRWQAKGYAARDIILLTGLSRSTVYRHLDMAKDPLLM